MAQVRRFKDADKEAVHTLFTNGMKDNMNALIWEAIKNVPGVKEACLAVPTLALIGARSFRSSSGFSLLFTTLAAAAVPVAVAVKLWSSLRDYVSHSLNDDLKNILDFYKHPSAFWVAELDGEVVGCTALQSHSADLAELRRMSVKAGLRRSGVAKKLGQTLIAHAKATGHKKVYLVTTSGQKPALALYKRLGWYEAKVWQSHGLTFHRLELDLE
mmetsp:Transcript_6679/g.17875  ORF Transcript_6679/g.17875 Transcript_6679/m.17875 type:complete len:215 (+) Transcript_6679:53-697(+)